MGLRPGEVGTDKVEVEDVGVVSPDCVWSTAMIPSSGWGKRSHVLNFKQSPFSPVG